MRDIRGTKVAMASLLLTVLLSASLESRAEEGIFDFLFGADSPSRSNNEFEVRKKTRRVPPKANDRAGNLHSPAGVSSRANSETAGGYCVRTCDGYFFPSNRQKNTTRQESCKLACPSAPMTHYSGSQIDRARNEKGESYKSLPTAFKFREKAVSNCECNSLDASEEDMARSSLSDPTLRPGDVVVALNGPVLYCGHAATPTFVSVELSSSISSTTRRRLKALFQNGQRIDRIGLR